MQRKLSVFDLFKIGIGPSSSHTVGPMRAAELFSHELRTQDMLSQVATVEVDVFGSLAATGRGHGTFIAILLGLEGYRPDNIAASEMSERTSAYGRGESIRLAGTHPLGLKVEDFNVRPFTMKPRHPNALTLTAKDASGTVLKEATYYSVGGGFVIQEGVPEATEGQGSQVPYPYDTADELLAICAEHGLSIAQVVWANECAELDEAEIIKGVLEIYAVMNECVDSAIQRKGNLPGGLNVPRRAPEWWAQLRNEDPQRRPENWQDWVNLIALAVNEENASWGRVVTAPTNGAAGVIPAVLHYAMHYLPELAQADEDTRERAVLEFFLTASAVGGIIKNAASFSGAEVGCQGEVGSACSMAAAGLAHLMGGTPEQVENAAEIAMEHNLGLTCDPVGGLVQIPCIERNAMGAVKAINATSISMRGDGTHFVSLDTVIEVMRQTGLDMSHKYKETSLGGLAGKLSLPSSVIEC